MVLDLLVVSGTSEAVPTSAVAALERDLATTLPAGYADIITTYGAGTVCDEFNVLPPDLVRARLEEARARWQEYWFWDDAVVTQDQMPNAVLIGDSANGDELVWVGGRLVVLPRHEDEVIDLGTSYEQALVEFCTSGRFVAPRTVLWFASWAERSWYENWSGGDFDRVVTAVRTLGLHAAEDGSPDGRAATFLVPAIGGHVAVAVLDGDPPPYVHLRYGVDKQAVADGLIRALEAAGANRGPRWGGDQA